MIHYMTDFLGKPFVDMKPVPREAIGIAAKLMKEERDWLDGTDILIASQALCDRYSTHLLTSDVKLVSSITIANEDYQMNRKRGGFRNHYLSIKPDF